MLWPCPHRASLHLCGKAEDLWVVLHLVDGVANEVGGGSAELSQLLQADAKQAQRVCVGQRQHELSPSRCSLLRAGGDVVDERLLVAGVLWVESLTGNLGVWGEFLFLKEEFLLL